MRFAVISKIGKPRELISNSYFSPSMNLSQRQIRAFLAIARLQSFTRAAEQLHISQAGLSSMLREVEGQLDCRLFDRTTRSVSLTAQGRAFVPVAERVISELETAAVTLGQLSDEGRGNLSVGATPFVAGCLLPSACSAFARTHPGVAVQVNDLERDQIHQRVRSGEIDVGFGMFLESTSSILRRPLVQTDLVLVTRRPPRASVWAEPVPWSALDGVRLLGLPADNPIQQHVNTVLGALAPDAVRVASYNTFYTVLAMTEAGMGSAVLPAFVASSKNRFSIRVASLIEPAAPLSFYEITKKGRQENALVKAFSVCLMDVMRKTITR